MLKQRTCIVASTIAEESYASVSIMLTEMIIICFRNNKRKNTNREPRDLDFEGSYPSYQVGASRNKAVATP